MNQSVLDNEINSSYETIISEIQATIENNDKMFQDLQRLRYDPAKDYVTDLKNYRINREITDVTETRNELWDVLDKKYKDNTRLRKFYFDEIVHLDMQLKKQFLELTELIDKVSQYKTGNSTIDRAVDSHKYNINYYYYYQFMYRVLLLVQAIIFVLLILGYLKKIPMNTLLVIIFVISIACLVFMLHYSFYKNLDRDKFYFDKSRPKDINKSEYESSIFGSNNCKDNKKQNKKPTQMSEEDIRLKESVDYIIKDSKKNSNLGKCS